MNIAQCVQQKYHTHRRLDERSLIVLFPQQLRAVSIIVFDYTLQAVEEFFNTVILRVMEQHYRFRDLFSNFETCRYAEFAYRAGFDWKDYHDLPYLKWICNQERSPGCDDFHHQDLMRDHAHRNTILKQNELDRFVKTTRKRFIRFAHQLLRQKKHMLYQYARNLTCQCQYCETKSCIECHICSHTFRKRKKNYTRFDGRLRIKPASQKPRKRLKIELSQN